MRTFEEITADLDQANVTNDVEVFLHGAIELDALNTPPATARAMLARGNVHKLRGEYTAAMEHYHCAIALYEELGERNAVAKVTSSIGSVHREIGNFPAALEHYYQALAIDEELDNRVALAGTTCNIGSVHLQSGDYPTALSHLHRALALCEEVGHRPFAANIIGNIGLVYQRTGDFTTALEYFQRSQAVHEELGNRIGVATAMANIGDMHMSLGDYPAALRHFQRALVLNEEIGNRSFEAIVSSNTLAVYVSTDLAAEAQSHLLSMDALQVDQPDVRIHIELQRATLQERSGDLDAASVTLQRALMEALKHNLRSEAAGTHKALRDLALKQNNLAGYVEHNNEYTRITEEINGKEATLKMAMQVKQREIDAREREHAQHMAVLHSTLPKHIADRVARGETVNDHYDNAAVIFLDIVGFTSISDRIPSGHVVHLLEQIFTTLDTVCEKHNVVKIKTIGDSYMAVSFETVMNAASCALDMIASLDALVITMPPDLGDTSWTKDIGDIKVRIGMHSGPVTAGVIGTQRMQYDVWGDTVNVASRMESTSDPGRIHISEAFALALGQGQQDLGQRSPGRQSSDEFPIPHSLFPRGEMEIKGKGLMNTYWLESTTT